MPFNGSQHDKKPFLNPVNADTNGVDAKELLLSGMKKVVPAFFFFFSLT